jgi:hypothetical protein
MNPRGWINQGRGYYDDHAVRTIGLLPDSAALSCLFQGELTERPSVRCSREGSRKTSDIGYPVSIHKKNASLSRPSECCGWGHRLRMT